MSQSNEPLANLTYKRSNQLIMAKYNSTLLEENIFAIAQARIEINAKDKDYPLEARLYPGDLKKLISDEAHIYRDLKRVANVMPGHTILLEDGKGNFKSFSMITNADYVDGVFIIKFNNELRDHLLELEQKGYYTKQELATKLNINKFSASRLYDVLCRDYYQIPPPTKSNPDPYFQVEYNLNELRFLMGLANNDNPNVVSARAKMKNIDYDELYEHLEKKEKKYEEWKEFKRRILEPAQENLKAQSNIRFEFEGIREGRKIKRVLFTIYRNIPANVDDIIYKETQLEKSNGKKERQLEIPYDTNPELYKELIGHNRLKIENIDAFLQEAKYDEDAVRNAVKKADEYSKKEYVDNYPGLIIDIIRGEWVKIPVYKGSVETAQKINEYKEEYIKTKSNDNSKEAVADKVWEKTKKREDFEDFKIAIFGNMQIEQIELIYSSEELFQAYCDYKFGRDVKI